MYLLICLIHYKYGVIMKKVEFINKQLQILFTADEISSPVGSFVVDDDLRVEMIQRLSRYVKKNAAKSYDLLKSKYSDDRQVDFVDDIDRDYTAGAGEEDLSKSTVSPKRKK